MRVAAKTDPGQVRRANEDCYSVGELPNGVVWAVICDGMGGAAGGNIASQTAVRYIAEAIVASWQEHMSPRAAKHLLVSALDNANLRVYDLAQANEELTGMGTTVVAVIVDNGLAYIAHAGDSRAYLCDGREMIQLTKDHSVVQVMVDSGQITEDEAKTHPRKNLITRALGVSDTLEADYCEEELPPGSLLLLCTDGLTNAVAPEEIPGILAESGFADLADALVRRANENGGPDNITVVAVENNLQ
ncbi:MAG: Stp1/IreP family PP2C-type Ser/Thr phosphatase [Oscillospiraceae bacterium]|jgi:protein phosphatase|nr:Stp1/IreP family PP2C-type Ser/Thr phosphatase [Oscillospiraceae bacterium]